MSDSPNSARPPSLEDLLRLKRAERPDPAFWQDFEEGLRRKQLAAIVEPRPWWLGVSLLARRVSVPVWSASAASAGIAALFALASLPTTADLPVAPRANPELAAVKASSPAKPEIESVEKSAPLTTPTPAYTRIAEAVPPEETPAMTDTSAEASTPRTETWQQNAEMLLAQLPIATAGLSVQVALDQAEAAPLPGNKNAGRQESEDGGDVAPVLLADLLPPHLEPADTGHHGAASIISVPALQQPEKAIDGPARHALRPLTEAENFAPDLVMAAFSEPAVASTVLADSSETSINPEELAPRHARLLSNSLPPARESEPLARVKDRIVRHLADGDQLYASATRVGVGGDRLSLRF